MEKVCCICKQSLSIDNFYIDRKNKDGHQSRCKTCNKHFYNKDRDKYLKRQRDKTLEYRFGITREEYDKMAESQDHVCFLCKNPDPVNKSLAVDHCHLSGKIRKLLCTRCNTALGSFKDDPDLLRAAATYVEEHR